MNGALKRATAAAVALGLWVTGARSEPSPISEQIEVTATRIPEPADKVPAFITLVDGADLARRRAGDLRAALSPVAGVEVSPGGDAGPASAVPSLWGLHEFDAFLLVVDGIPWGGAFNPAISTLDFNDVQRVEVVKGSAPVMYGATSFVGVIQVLHYRAGESSGQLDLAGGSYGSWRASSAVGLPGHAPDLSLALSAVHDGFSDPREAVGEGHALLRLAAPAGAGGAIRFDADLAVLRSTPPSPVVREDAGLTSLTPLDANFNPLDARIDETRGQVVLGYSRGGGDDSWETTGSLAYSRVADIRGFLRSDLSGEADSQNQRRSTWDGYLDSHLTRRFGELGSVVLGADLLYGFATQQSRNGAYDVALDGRGPLPRTSDLHVDEINGLRDRRIFAGQYAQFDRKAGDRLDVNLGLRVNETRETKRSSHLDGFDPTADLFDQRARTVVRLSGMAGVSWTASQDADRLTVLYADYRNTFKPSAIDFGPDYTPDVLAPERASSWEAGAKGRLAGGQIAWQAGLFLMNFDNLVVATEDGFRNAGSERLKGVEAEARWRVHGDLEVDAAVSWHDARFVHATLFEDGADADVSGKRLTLSPPVLASVTISLDRASGVYGSVSVSYVDRRYLDQSNTATATPYAAVDVVVGYRWRRWSLALTASNLTDQRPPISQSEFGDGSYYLLPARKILVSLTTHL